MKKYLYLMAALMLGLTATVSLAACGDDDDDSEAKVAAYAEAEYSVVLSDDIVKFYNVKVKYTGLGEDEMNEQVTSKVWSNKKGSSKGLPVTFKYKFSFEPKGELPAKINLSYKPNVTIKVFNKDGKQLRSPLKLSLSPIESTGLDTSVYDPQETLDRCQFSYTVPADGTLKDIEKK
ncbi:MAG: hypothetical protein SPL50_00395 [Alloprevotella sp.]|nr:hypothetical protein [Alloprevotella sp.]MDY6296744.1 hypothetical protein [Alloprevotella sp.]